MPGRGAFDDDLPPPQRGIGPILGIVAGLLAALTDAFLVVTPPIIVFGILGRWASIVWAFALAWPLLFFFPVFGLLRGLHHGYGIPTFWGVYKTCNRDLLKVGDVLDPFQRRQGLNVIYYVHFFAALLVGLGGVAAWLYPMWLPRLLG